MHYYGEKHLTVRPIADTNDTVFVKEDYNFLGKQHVFEPFFKFCSKYKRQSSEVTSDGNRSQSNLNQFLRLVISR